MNTTGAETLAALYREGNCVRTGRKGMRPSLNGDVFAEEWRAPEGITFWRETGDNPDPRIGSYEGFRQSFPEDRRTDLIGVDLPNADPEKKFVEPIGDWDPIQSADWDRTTYFTADGRERSYPFNDVMYAREERFRRARGCNCLARYDGGDCDCPDENFEDSHMEGWLRRVRKPDGTPAWQKCKYVEVNFNAERGLE
jgi:hypothetical protein